MKQKNLTWTFFLLLTNFTVFGQTGVIEGHVYDRREEKGLALANVWLLNTKLGTVTDLKGNFKIDNIPNGIYDLKVSFIGYGDTTLKALKVSCDTLLKIRLELPPPCKYDKHRKNKSCPVCGREDEVVPIIYGFPMGEPDEQNYFYAGCAITSCDPNWYCKRDKHKF